MVNQDIEPKDDNITAQHYLVIFLDVLGQRSILRRIRNLPTTDEEKKDFIEKIRKTYGAVSALREGFNNYFESVKAHIPNTNMVPPEIREEYIAAQRCESYTYSFSDSIIIAVPLMSNDDNCTAMNGVFSAFLAAAGVGTLALATEICLRGGLEVGVALPIEGGEIYGPALERAYFLENNQAEYPRFVVGHELMQYLDWVESRNSKSNLGRMSERLAKACREMIIRDTDGRLMLDFLGPTVKEAMAQSIKTEELEKIRNFIAAQHQKFFKLENHKLASRYYRLMRYFNYRAELWGLEPTNI